MLIRAERAEDVIEIDRVTASAFDREDGQQPPEVSLIRALRGSESWIPQLSLVALEEDRVVGHCLSSRAHIDQNRALALGPISVEATQQRRGIGSALMRLTIDVASEMSEIIIGLLGDPNYYRRFGFVPGVSVGVDPPQPVWGDYFQVRSLRSTQPPRGVFEYPDEFGVVS